jgi:hypothetical protein
MAIKDVRVWRNKTKTECRVYVHTTDGREGCKYLTGNHFQARGTMDGKLTAEDWQEAKALALVDGRWTTVDNSGPRNTRPEPEELEDLVEINKRRPESHVDRGYMMMEDGSKV